MSAPEQTKALLEVIAENPGITSAELINHHWDMEADPSGPSLTKLEQDGILVRVMNHAQDYSGYFDGWHVAAKS